MQEEKKLMQFWPGGARLCSLTRKRRSAVWSRILCYR
jgi:hypothetical protein